MTRKAFIESVRRQIYNGQPPDDATVSVSLVNSYIPAALGVAAKQSWVENIKIDNIAYLNNSFYITFTGLAIEKDSSQGMFIWKITLPEIPIGLGKNEGVASFKIKDGVNVSYDGIPLNINQVGFVDGLRPVPKRITYWPEGQYIYAKTVLNLSGMTAIVRMVSGGSSTDLNSTLNVPSEWLPIMRGYILKELLTEKTQPMDDVADGVDLPTAK